MSKRFKDRSVSVTVTDEWIQAMIDADDPDIKGLFSEHLLWFERNYNAVVEMKQPDGSRHYKIQAIAATDADTEEIHRGLRNILVKCEREQGSEF